MNIYEEKRKPVKLRNFLIARKIINGSGYEEVGRDHGLTRERIRQITYRVMKDACRLAGIKWAYPKIMDVRKDGAMWIQLVDNYEAKCEFYPHYYRAFNGRVLEERYKN